MALIDPLALPESSLAFLEGGGEMGELIRSFDWSSTPLGPISTWPQSLRTAVSICLTSRFPITIYWGREYIRLYNDAYLPILGAEKHPQFLGRPARECWPEIWDVIGPMLDRVREFGVATWEVDLPLRMQRHGYLEEAYFTFSYAPLRDEQGAVGGIFCTTAETTPRVLNERRLETLRALSVEAHSVEDAAQGTVEAMAANRADLPFVLLYLLDRAAGSARLLASTGVIPGTSACPDHVSLSPGASSPWSVAELVSTGEPVRVDNLAERMDTVPAGPWPEPPREAVLLPLTRPGRPEPVGTLVVGINSRRRLDPEYQSFLQMLARQVGVAIANACAQEDERALRRELEGQRARLQEIFTEAPAFIATLRGPEHVFELANPQYLMLIGRENIVGKPVREALPEIEGQGFFELLDQVYQTGQRFIGQDVSIQIRRGGQLEQRWVSFVYQPLQEADGTVTGIFVHGVDVTDPVRARQSLEQLAELNRTITNNATAALFMMDTRGHCTYMNPAAEAMTGFRLEEIREMPLHEAIHHHRPDGTPFPLAECPIDRALPERSQVRAHEDVFIRKDGTFFPVLCTAEPVIDNGVPRGTVVEVRDLSAEKQAAAEREELLRREKAAREAAEAVTKELRQQHERQQVVTRYLRAANRASAQLITLKDIDEMLNVVLETLRTQFVASLAGIWLVEPGTQTLRLRADLGLGAAPTPSLAPELHIPTHPFKMGWVARTRRPYISNDLEGDLQFDQAWLAQTGFRSAAIFPLRGQGELLGALAIFSEHELPLEVGEVLSTLAATLSIRLENAQLREDVAD